MRCQCPLMYGSLVFRWSVYPAVLLWFKCLLCHVVQFCRTLVILSSLCPSGGQSRSPAVRTCLHIVSVAMSPRSGAHAPFYSWLCLLTVYLGPLTSVQRAV